LASKLLPFLRNLSGYQRKLNAVAHRRQGRMKDFTTEEAYVELVSVARAKCVP
jgi:hypothetical protein